MILCTCEMNIRRCPRLFFQQFYFRKFHTSMEEPPTEFLKINDAEGTSGRVAYQKISGPRNEGLLFIPGFLAYKSGTKATKLLAFCREQGFPYVRYDPSGLGESQDLRLDKARFRDWIQDAEEVLLKLTNGKQIIVGSSMGGWIAILLALKHPEKFSKLILVAPGINFSDYLLHKFKSALPSNLFQKLEKGETVQLTFEDYGTFPISLSLLESFNEHNVDFTNKIKIDCPVRILHGIKDKDVPYELSLTLLQSISSEDIRLHYFKDGDHSLSSEKFLKELCDDILCNT